MQALRFWVLWATLAVIAFGVLLFEPHPWAKLASGLSLIVGVVGLYDAARRRHTLATATCPDDGQRLELELARWGPRGVPLMRCVADRRTYYVSRWTPFELTPIDLAR